MEEMGTAGVEVTSSDTVAAEQGSQVEQNTNVSAEGTATPTGETTQSPAAEGSTAIEDKTEIAFAKRLAAERQKIEAEAVSKAQAMLREQDPALKFVNKIAQENGMTPDELVQYWQEEQERRELEALKSQGISEDLAKKLQKYDQLEAKLSQREQQEQFQAKVDRDLREFTDAYPNVKMDSVPDEVFDICRKQGVSLLDAYNRVYAPKRIAELEKAQAIQDKNAKNANSTPGSVTGQGNIPSDFISETEFEANKGNRRWMIDNLSKITKSRTKW